MNFQLRPHLTTAERRLPFECATLLLQGGGALGAYQGGVYEALAEADIHPDWVAGISIGAINAAIIAGNPPNTRVDRLQEFWTHVTSSAPWDWLGNPFGDLARGDDARNLVAIALALQSGYTVSGLVLASGYYFPTFRMDFWLMSGPAVPLLGDLMRYTISPIISWAVMPTLFRTLFAPRAVPPEFKNEFPTSLSLRPKQLRAAAEESAFLIPIAAQLQHQYQVIPCPVRIVHGKGDRLIEIDQSLRLHEALPRSLLHLVGDAGHMVTYADTPEIADAVAALAVPPTLVTARRR